MTPRRERALTVLLVVSLTLFALLAVWARFDSPAPWEPAALAAAAVTTGPLRDIVSAVNTLGNLPVWVLVVSVTALAVGRARGRAAAVAIGASVLSDLGAFAVKLVVERERPDTAATHHFFGPDSFSFPSGHVVRAVALVMILVWLVAPARGRPAVTLAAGVAAGAVMGFARVSLGVHWPTDTLGGLLLGVAWFALTALFLTRSDPAR